MPLAAALPGNQPDAPWTTEAPPLDGLERGEAEPSEVAWHRTLLFIDDLLASATNLHEPDVNDVPARVRTVARALAAHVAAGFARVPLDDLQRAVEFLAPAVGSILAQPNTRLARTHQHVRWERLDELDARSLAWMSRLPGRTMREKSASTSRALGVVRAQTHDVAENRLLLRLARDLQPWLERRIDAVPWEDSKPLDRIRRDQLVGFHHLLRVDAPRTLMNVAPAVRPEPNNALLGQGRYGRIWRGWRWFVHRQERFATRWQLGVHLLKTAIVMMLVERLSSRADAFLVDDLSMWGLGWHTAARSVLAPSSIEVLLLASEPRCVSLQIPPERDPLRIVVRGGESMLVESTLEIDLAFDPSGLLDARGCPVRATWIDFERDLIGEVEAPFDAEGIDRLVDPVVAALQLSPPAPTSPLIVAGDRCEVGIPAKSELVSVDLGGALPVLVDEDGVMSLAECCTTASFGGEHVPGNDSLAMQPYRDLEARFFLSSAWDSMASGECPASDLTRALASVAPPDASRDRELCVPVPEGLGEPGEALLRAALPSHIRRTWFVPRAVAAAMALQTCDVHSVGVDDAVVVLDCGPLGLEARLMLLRATDPGDAETFYWECPLPWPSQPSANAGATRTFWRELTREAAGPSVDQRYIDLLVDSGVTARIAVEPECRRGACLFGERGQLGTTVTVTNADLLAAAERYSRVFGEWLDSIGPALVEAKSHAGLHRLHLLAVGDPLSVPEVAAAVGARCSSAIPEAVVHVQPVNSPFARGGADFLRRYRRGLPTFELALPDLFLRSVGSSGIATSRAIFEKQRVRPGQEITVAPMPFEIPAGVPRIELPLERERGRRRPLSFKAVLDGEGFPLRSPMRVELQVTYRYAEDGFRIRIRPQTIDERSIAFSEREVRWVRADVEVESRVINNDAPAFPASAPDPSSVENDIPKSAEAFGRDSELDLSDFVGRRRAGQRQNPGGVRDLLKRIDTASRDVAAYARASRHRALGPATVKTLSDSWVTPLCLLADCSVAPYTKRRVPSWAPKTGDIRRASPRLRLAALGALSRLGCHAPTSVPVQLLRELEELERGGRPLEEQVWMSLGRTLSVLPSPERARALVRIAEAACLEPQGSPPSFGPWWALATALWSEETLALGIPPETVHRLVDRIAAIVDSPSPPQQNVFHEAGIVLFALLRRRGHPDPGPVDAGIPALRHLADRFEELDRKFVAAGQRREPRLKLARQNDSRVDVTLFVDSLAAALRGERVALIRSLDEE